MSGHFKIPLYLLNPYHKSIESVGVLEKGGCHPLFVCLWFLWLPFAFVLALFHGLFGYLCFVSVVSSDEAKWHFDFIGYSFLPIDVRIRHDVPN